MATVFAPRESSASDQFTPKAPFISLCQYEAASESMTITFKTGSQYRYLYINPSTWESFKQAKDHASFYANAIKGKFNAIPLVRQPIGKPRPKSLAVKRSPNNVGVFNAGIRHAERIGQWPPGNIPPALRK